MNQQQTSRLEVGDDVFTEEPIILLNAKIVNYNDVVSNDILMEEGVIKKVGRQLAQRHPNARRIDLQGRFVFPGGIDVMTRIVQNIRGDPTADDIFSATKMAIAGGTTTIIESVNCPKRSSLLTKFESIRELFSTDSCCDFSFHLAVAEFNAEVEKEMKTLCNVHGVNSFQFFTGYFQEAMLEDDALYDAFVACRKMGALAMVQAENGRFTAKKEQLLVSRGVKGPEAHYLSRPEEMECTATEHAMIIADHASCPLILSPVASGLAAERLSEFQAQGKVVQAYCTIASLSLLGSHVFSPDWMEASSHVASPPLRGKQTQDTLLALLAKGTVAMCASAHSQFRLDQREMGRDDFRLIPEGVPGVHERMSLLWEKAVATGLMDPIKFVNATSVLPAKIFGLFPKKGFIGEGSDADLVVWNPSLPIVRRQFPSKSMTPGVELNVYDRVVITGGPQMVFLRGREVARSVADGRLELVLMAGQGRYLPRATFPPHLYNHVFNNEKKNRDPMLTRPTKLGLSSEQHSMSNSEEESGNGKNAFSQSGEKVVNQHHTSHVNSAMTVESGDAYIMNRARTAGSGPRNHLESSFSFNDGHPTRSSVRVQQPPGGNSSRLW